MPENMTVPVSPRVWVGLVYVLAVACLSGSCSRRDSKDNTPETREVATQAAGRNDSTTIVAARQSKPLQAATKPAMTPKPHRGLNWLRWYLRNGTEVARQPEGGLTEERSFRSLELEKVFGTAEGKLLVERYSDWEPGVIVTVSAGRGGRGMTEHYRNPPWSIQDVHAKATGLSWDAIARHISEASPMAILDVWVDCEDGVERDIVGVHRTVTVTVMAKDGDEGYKKIGTFTGLRQYDHYLLVRNVGRQEGTAPPD